MLKKTYTAVFHPELEAGGYSISFPDLPGCYTQGNDIDEALRMATDALGLYLYTLKEDKMPFPPASHPSDIKTDGRDFTTLITWDEAEYLRGWTPSPENVISTFHKFSRAHSVRNSA